MTSSNRTHLFVRPQLQTILDGVVATPPLSFSLIGAKFMGKTRILTQLADTSSCIWQESLQGVPPKYTPLPIYFDCAWPEAKPDIFTFLTTQIEQHLEKHVPNLQIELHNGLTEQESKDALRHLTGQLTSAGYRPILLLDNFDTWIIEASAEMEHKINQLRPLTREVVLVVASEQPLHEANRKLASSPLFNLLNQVFLRLIEPHAMETYLQALTADYEDQAELVHHLARWTGGHPFLLSRVGEILRDVGTLPTGQQINADHLPLIRLRLSEDYGRLLFGQLRRTLEAQEEAGHTVPLELVRRLLVAPFPFAQIRPDEARAFYWLLNSGMVRITGTLCELFSPLFSGYLQTHIEAMSSQSPQLVSQQTPRAIMEAKAEEFTPQERNLLRFFLEHPDEIITIDQLLVEVWKRPDASARRVQEGIRRLRNRLEDLQLTIGNIENEWGQGYRFVPISESEHAQWKGI